MWAEFRILFRISKFIIFMQAPYINLLRYHEKCFTAGSVIMSRIQNIYQSHKICYFYAAAIYKFSIILNKILYRGKRRDKQNWEHFSECRSIIFMQPPYIIFLKYHEQSFTVGSVIMNRIQNTFHNLEVYYISAAAIYWYSKLLWKIPYRLKRHNEQNSEHFSECGKRHDEQNSERISECRSVLFLWSRNILIF